MSDKNRARATARKDQLRTHFSVDELREIHATRADDEMFIEVAAMLTGKKIPARGEGRAAAVWIGFEFLIDSRHFEET